MERKNRPIAAAVLALAAMLFLPAGTGHARIDGTTGTRGTATAAFSLTAKAGTISTPDGNSIYNWGYADNGATGSGRMQFPGPTLIVYQGDTVTVTLRNELAADNVNVSIVFPGQRVTASGGVAGRLTREAPPDGTTAVAYTFVADRPGTYLYHSGTRPDLQVEMGLVGALIVRPAVDPEGRAYNHPDTAYDHEVLFLITEMDPDIHELVALGWWDEIVMTDYFPVYWFLNGRAAPDTMFPAYAGWLPNQPYNCMPRLRPGERLLMRVVGAGRDMHPYHHHGNHARIVARDGRVLTSAPGTGPEAPDIGYSVFTIPSVPGETVDAIFTWTGEGLGWDIYGTGPGHEHLCNGLDVPSGGFDPVTKEYCPDHGKPIPVLLPEQQNLTFGGFYSGSPYMGTGGFLPPGEGGLNPNGGFAFMWHSHTEKEMTNYDVFPGGMMTMMIVEPPGTPIE